MLSSQRHRGPDAHGLHVGPSGAAGLGNCRLSIVDLSPAGTQPMTSRDGCLVISFNGEVYNHRELRAELGDYPFSSGTDTEVILAAYERWGADCLERLVGMFAFVIWDEREQRLFAARDRFGVKPLHYCSQADGRLFVASEIKALHAAGVPARPDAVAWATYLTLGVSDHSERTFWEGVHSLPPGHSLTWKDGRLSIARWYDLADRSGLELDSRPAEVVRDEYLSLLAESVRLRFRSDVPVGLNLSGGLDSSTLLGLVQSTRGDESGLEAFTFATGDPRYDEVPWVRKLLADTRHEPVLCGLEPGEVPALAESVQAAQDEPFGGIPTLAYARLFERARERGAIVLLDGQGLDEQWAGYDYYGAPPGAVTPVVQGSTEGPVRPQCLHPEFRALAESLPAHAPFPDRLRNLQYRDARYTKLPRALRFNDRISMRASTELREPFLDHRLFELALRQPPERKVMGEDRKVMLRSIGQGLVPAAIREVPKRPVQTPQREWLRGPLREWAGDLVETAVDRHSAWLDADAVRETWSSYRARGGDTSFYIWQWISLGLEAHTRF
jgi:asparagine synthase (glutamine-hydrolysing)